MYRNREEKMLQMSACGENSSNDTWFRSSGATSTLIVPATPNRILADCVKKNLDKLGLSWAKLRTKLAC